MDFNYFFKKKKKLVKLKIIHYNSRFTTENVVAKVAVLVESFLFHGTVQKKLRFMDKDISNNR